MLIKMLLNTHMGSLDGCLVTVLPFGREWACLDPRLVMTLLFWTRVVMSSYNVINIGGLMVNKIAQLNP